MPIIEEQPDLHFPLTLKRRGQGEQDCEEEEEKVFYQTPMGKLFYSSMYIVDMYLVFLDDDICTKNVKSTALCRF